MPPKKRNHDEDYVVPSSYKKETKIPPPEPWEFPSFEPLSGVDMQDYGKPCLPDEIDATIPIDLFDALWTPEIVDLLVKSTNVNREANPPDKPDGWKDVTIHEMYGYLGIILWGNLWKTREMRLLWVTDNEKAPLHTPVRKCMSRRRWEQIERHIHVTTPPPDGVKQSPFQKISQLSSLLQANFTSYYTPGTHLAVDECIQRFLGRSPATVNIPTKPIPEGYKVWVLAHHGYVLNWLWHHKGEKHGPIDLDVKWLAEGFSKTEAVVLTLVSRLPNEGKGCVIYLDNLFTTARLLRTLREIGVGAAGTARTSKTAREEWDEKQAQKQAGQEGKSKENTNNNASQSSQTVASDSQTLQSSQTFTSDSQTLQSFQSTQQPPESAVSLNP
jgi:hypothetical protein